MCDYVGYSVLSEPIKKKTAQHGRQSGHARQLFKGNGNVLDSAGKYKGPEKAATLVADLLP